MALVRAQLLLLPVVAGVALVGCSSTPPEKAFCDKVRKAGSGALAIDPAVLQDKVKLKATIEGFKSSPLLSIKDSEVPTPIKAQVITLRTSLEAVQSQLVANDYDISKIDLSQAIGLQSSATAVASYAKTSCGVDLIPTTTAGATTTTAKAG